MARIAAGLNGKERADTSSIASEIVQDGHNGLLFPAGDAAALGERFEQLSKTRGLLAQLSRNTDVPSVDEDVRRLVEIYGELLAAKAVRT